MKKAFGILFIIAGGFLSLASLFTLTTVAAQFMKAFRTATAENIGEFVGALLVLLTLAAIVIFLLVVGVKWVKHQPKLVKTQQEEY